LDPGRQLAGALRQRSSPKLLLLDSNATSATITVGRIAGVRDLVLGLVTLAALEDPDRLRLATLANAAADAGDAVAFGFAMRTEERTAGNRGIAAALPAALAGIWVAWRLS